MKIEGRILISSMLLFLLSGTCPAQSGDAVIKLATLAPRDSTWHRIIEGMGARWKQESGGRIQLKIQAGTAGDESDIMRKVRVGQLQAAAVTTVGLGAIDAATQALHIPLAFQSQEELDYVQSRIRGRMEKALDQKGFVVLNWGETGWIRFFTKAPVVFPADLKKLKLFVWATGKSSDDIWKDNGFQTVALASTDILTSLQTGMVGAIQVPPLAALANQWFAITRYMTDLRWAPLTGATIISKTAWARIPKELQPLCLKISEEAGEQMQREIREAERQAIDAMVKRGLTVVQVPPEAESEWQKLVESTYPRLRGDLVPAEEFDEVMKLRNEFRAFKNGRGR